MNESNTEHNTSPDPSTDPFKSPDLIALDKQLQDESKLEAEMAWQYTPSRPFEPIPGRTIDSRNPETGEITLPPGHIALLGDEAVKNAVHRVNDTRAA